MHQVFEQRRIQDRRGLKVLACYRRAHYGEDAAADHRANTKRSQAPRTERLLKTMLGILGVSNQLVDRFAAQELRAFRRLVGRRGWMFQVSFRDAGLWNRVIGVAPITRLPNCEITDYRLLCPRTIFFTFLFFEPRG